MTTGQLNSLPFSGFTPVPFAMLAAPPVEKLDQDGKNKLFDSKVGEFTADMFPDLTVHFPMGAWAPLYADDLDTERALMERALAAPVAFGVQYSGTIPSLTFPVGGCVLSWVPQSNDEFVDYWKTNIWKYERRFTVQADSYWLADAVYTTGSSAALDRNDALWELAQLGDEGSAAITRYFTTKPKTGVNALTTEQLDAIGVDDVRVKSSDLLGFLATNAGDGFDATAAADWALFYDQPFVMPEDPGESSQQFAAWTEQGNVFDRQLQLFQPMTNSANDWAGFAEYTSQFQCVANRNDLAYRGAMFRQLNTSLNPLYECAESGTVQRSINAKAPFKNWASFCDHQGLAWAMVTAVPQDYAPNWRRLCKVHRTIHYLQVPWKKFAEKIDATGQALAGRPDENGGWEAATAEETGNMVPSFYGASVSPTVVQDGTLYWTQPWPQIVGFSREQAEKQFPKLIQTYSAYLYNEMTIAAEEDARWDLSFKFLNYQVQVTPAVGDPYTETRTDSAFFPWDPRSKVQLGYGAAATTVRFKLKLVGSAFVVEEVTTLGIPFVTEVYANRTETYVPSNFDELNPPECIWKFAEGIALFYTGMYQSITDCGQYIIKSKSGDIVAEVPLYGIPKVGELKITWTPHVVDIP